MPLALRLQRCFWAASGIPCVSTPERMRNPQCRAFRKLIRLEQSCFVPRCAAYGTRGRFRTLCHPFLSSRDARAKPTPNVPSRTGKEEGLVSMSMLCHWINALRLANGAAQRPLHRREQRSRSAGKGWRSPTTNISYFRVRCKRWLGRSRFLPSASLAVPLCDGARDCLVALLLLAALAGGGA